MQRGLLARHAQEDLVAFGAAGPRSARDLLRDVAKLADALPSGAKGSEVLLVIRNDRYALAISILAAWARDYVPVLPPELDRDAITALASPARTVCVLHDTVSGIPLQVARVLEQAQAVAPCEASTWRERTLASRTYARDDAQALAPQAWGDDWLQQARTLSELVALEAGQRCATSVGPGHPHGVVLGVLVPLLTGSAFLREPLPAHRLGSELTAHAIDVLVSVPAHLPEVLAGADKVAAKVRRVISALDPLSPALARDVSARLGAQVSDLAGSAAQAPILHCGHERRASATALGGEPDARMLRFLRAQPGVRDAAVVRVGTSDGARPCVAVTGEQLDLPTLQRALAAEHDAPAHALELLAVGKIRRDAVGRVQESELLRQFGRRADGRAVNYAIDWLDARTSEQAGMIEHSARVQIPADSAYFDGHFPGYPILSGAAQLSALVLPHVRRVRPELRRLTGMSRLKFSGRITPGETIDVVLTSRPDTETVDFALRRGATLCAAGTLSFAGEDEP